MELNKSAEQAKTFYELNKDNIQAGIVLGIVFIAGAYIGGRGNRVLQAKNEYLISLTGSLMDALVEAKKRG